QDAGRTDAPPDAQRRRIPGRRRASQHAPAVGPPGGVHRSVRQRLHQRRGRHRRPPRRRFRYLGQRRPGRRCERGGRRRPGLPHRARRCQGGRLHRGGGGVQRVRHEVDAVRGSLARPWRLIMDLLPRPEHRFSFGLWTVGNVGRDPFGLPTRPPLDPVHSVANLAALGAWGVNFHDDDLVPPGSSAHERDRIVREFRQALDDHGMVVPMATTNLFTDPVFKDGAFTSADARVRAYALQKTMRAMDLGVELGARTYVFWGGREGSEVDGAGKLLDALSWYRDALDFLCDYAIDQD